MAFPTVPYIFDNESFDSDNKDEWVNWFVRMAGSEQHTLNITGARRFRRRGLVFAQIYVAEDRGLLRLDALAKTARDFFEGKTINNVWFTDTEYREVGPTEGSFLGTVITSFSFDETK